MFIRSTLSFNFGWPIAAGNSGSHVGQVGINHPRTKKMYQEYLNYDLIYIRLWTSASPLIAYMTHYLVPTNMARNPRCASE